MKQLVSEGFLKQNTKAFRPDEETGKWRGAVSKNGNFGTIKPAWTGEIKINNIPHMLEVWTFNTRWGSQSLFHKLYKVKDEKSLEEQM